MNMHPAAKNQRDPRARGGLMRFTSKSDVFITGMDITLDVHRVQVNELFVGYEGSNIASLAFRR
ncbi:MAG: hypothetical protein QG577_2095 [Thermodesulfobacteriota bacterium]|nr:hypothetical protein [Thermodesulfobacteriota bacterium]